MSNTGVKVWAPASVANLGCGYDILGLCLEKPGDEIIARFSGKKGLRITKITGSRKQLPTEVEKNTAGVAAMKMLEHIGESDLGIDLEIHKKMPFGSGLGSSAASAVGGVMAINELLKRPLTKREMLPFAVLGEQVADGSYHADNVAPSLLGGIIFIRDNATLDVHRIPNPKGLQVVCVYPHIKILTKDARDILSDQTTLKNTITQTGNLGGLIVGMYNADLDLISRSLNDVIIEPQRSKLIPGFYDVKDAAMNQGAMGCSISGAGPTIFAICPNTFVAENAAAEMKAVFKKNKIKSDIFISPINQNGSYLF